MTDSQKIHFNFFYNHRKIELPSKKGGFKKLKPFFEINAFIQVNGHFSFTGCTQMATNLKKKVQFYDNSFLREFSDSNLNAKKLKSFFRNSSFNTSTMYTKQQLLNLRNSPLSQERPKDLKSIPGVTTDTPPSKRQCKGRRRTKSEPPKQEPPIKQPLQFQFITRMGGLDGTHFQENYICMGIAPSATGYKPVYQKKA